MAKVSEGKAAETRTNKTNAKGTTQAAPIQLELFDGDTLAVCDVETGLCTVPNSGSSTSKIGEPTKPASEKQAR